MNMMRIFYIGLSGVGMMFSSITYGHDARDSISGVRRCLQPYICVNSSGISRVNENVWQKAAENLQSLQGYDPSEFTFANGVFCDVKEKLCRDDRYFGVDGKRSGKINQITTKMLFMCRE